MNEVHRSTVGFRCNNSVTHDCFLSRSSRGFINLDGSSETQRRFYSFARDDWYRKAEIEHCTFTRAYDNIRWSSLTLSNIQYLITRRANSRAVFNSSVTKPFLYNILSSERPIESQVGTLAIDDHMLHDGVAPTIRLHCKCITRFDRNIYLLSLKQKVKSLELSSILPKIWFWDRKLSRKRTRRVQLDPTCRRINFNLTRSLAFMSSRFWCRDTATRTSPITWKPFWWIWNV